MTLADLVTTIIVVTILLALAVALVTYVTRGVRRTRRVEPEPSAERGSRYFVRYSPEARLDRRS